MTEQEKELMKHFKVEELEERLEMRSWGQGGGHNGSCGPTGGSCGGHVPVK